MTLPGVPAFGKKAPHENYVVRPGAYAVIFDRENRVAAMRGITGYFLPGGGIEAGETPDAAVLRELQEEAGLRPLQLVRKLGVSDVVSIVARNELLRRHCYLFDGNPLPDSWQHTVIGAGEDKALRFAYQWHTIPRDFSLSGDLGYFLSPLHIPELYRHDALSRSAASSF